MLGSISFLFGISYVIVSLSVSAPWASARERAIKAQATRKSRHITTGKVKREKHLRIKTSAVDCDYTKVDFQQTIRKLRELAWKLERSGNGVNPISAFEVKDFHAGRVAHYVYFNLHF